MDSKHQVADPITDEWLGQHFDHTASELGLTLSGSLRRMRSLCPVAHSDRHGGFWVLTKYDDVARAAQDWGTFSSADGVGLPRPIGQPKTIPVEVDPPLQRTYRRLINRYLAPAAVNPWEPRTRALASRLVDEFADAGECEFMEAFGRPFPSIAFFEYTLNAPGEDVEKVASWSFTASNPSEPEAGACFMNLSNWINDFVEYRRGRPAMDDIVDGILNADIDGRPISHEEVVGIILVLILGGLETTTGALGSMMVRFSEQPEVPALLRANPERIPDAVEELLRLDGPFVCITRTTTCDVEVGGRQIKKGEKVLLYWASADRDDDQYADSDSFDLERGSGRHLAFGVGPHRCVGSSLARMQLRVALEEILRRIDDIRLRQGASIEYHSAFVRSPVSVPLTFSASR